METDQSGQPGQVVPQSISFLGLDINTSPLPRVLDHIAHLSLSSLHRFLVTRNVDHVVLLESAHKMSQIKQFRAAYQSATLRLCDSGIIAGLARLKGIILPIIPGIDLTALLMSHQFCKPRKSQVGTASTVDIILQLFPEPNLV